MKQTGLKEFPTVSFLRFLRHASNIVKNPLPFHNANFKRLGDSFELKIGPKATVIFSKNAEYLRYTLQKNQRNYTKSKIQTKDLAKYVGRGLLTAEGDHWQRQRKLIQPAFHKKQLQYLLDTMQTVIAKELQNIQLNQAANIHGVFNDLAFQTVIKTLFSGGVTSEQIAQLQRTTEEAQQMMVKELRQPFLVWWFKSSGKIQKHLDAVGEARDMLKGLVNQRRESGKRYDDLLDMLLDARYEDGTEIAEEQLIDEILILFVAGHETTSNALTFTCELLARHPEALKKVREEAVRLSSSGEDIMSMLKGATYIQQVLQESMRLYPPAYFIDRVNYEEDQLGAYRLPKDSTVLFSVYEIHRSETYWERPLEFDPDRFDPQQPRQHSDYYFPFGAGPRMCIGNNFAMYEMILALIQLFSQHTIEHKKSPIDIRPLITLKPKDAILVFRAS
ncbi:cytochrome P450 [Gilvibacter sediminis]|uniref:cytochrome P450 n=1 Tax=Gilvibacter sediminis TaxID=379071 RepID=UPI00234FEE47|nr:cytochrome P450 [Gilvibacter sediminis]MDC7996416.1 cytochrome P450 [Gilvibacter sediminis]